MADFPFFKMAPSAIFKSWKFQLPVRFGGAICVVLPNFMVIGRTVPEMADFRFSRWRPSAILDLFYACFTTFGGLYDCAKFGCNRRSNFDCMQILIFCTSSLKMLIHAPKVGVFLGFYPQNGDQYERDPKRHIVGRKHVVRRIGRQNRSTCADSARAEV